MNLSIINFRLLQVVLEILEEHPGITQTSFYKEVKKKKSISYGKFQSLIVELREKDIVLYSTSKKYVRYWPSEKGKRLLRKVKSMLNTIEEEW